MPANQNGHQSKRTESSDIIIVLVVAGHDMLQRALVDLINEQPHIEVCACVSNARDVERSLTGQQEHSVVILDWPVTDQSYARALRGLLHKYSKARWLVVSLYDDAFSVKSALDMGAQGYVSKSMVAEKICTAIRALAAGQRYLSPDVRDALPKSYAKEILA